MTWVARLLPVRSGEARAVVGVGVVAALYAAAVTTGDLVAQSVFVGRVGAHALPNIFLLKAAIDTVAALLYMPMTRRRHPVAVLRLSFALYAVVVVGGRLLVSTTDGATPAYVLYVAHECAWTVLTIHWGVYLLEVFDASQARRLFPLLFGATRLGGVVAGVATGFLAVHTGAVTLLWLSAGLAVMAIGASFLPKRQPHERLAPAQGEGPSETAADEEAAVSMRMPAVETTWARWRRVWSSPLVKAIAASTALMVIVRYALRMVSAGHIEHAFYGDEDLIAEFLGRFDAFGNVVSAIVGVLILPRLLATLGVGAINAAYAVATIIAQGAVLLWPSLGTAAGARFAETSLKDGLKTPLSALFYGAEAPDDRAPSRALIFGAVIPLATVAAAGVLTLARHSADPLGIAASIGAGVAIVFALVCLWQNRAWRKRLDHLLVRQLARTTAGTEPELADKARADLAPFAESLGPDRLDCLVSGFASRDRRIRALAEEVLTESIPRQAAHSIARHLRGQSREGRLREAQPPR